MHPNFVHEEDFGIMIGPFADMSAKSGLDVQLGTIISFRHPQTNMHHACGQGWKKEWKMSSHTLILKLLPFIASLHCPYLQVKHFFKFKENW